MVQQRGCVSAYRAANRAVPLLWFPERPRFASTRIAEEYRGPVIAERWNDLRAASTVERLAAARKAFETTGVATLPAFLPTAALLSATAEVGAKLVQAHNADVRHNVLQRDPDPLLPPDAVRNREQHTRVSCLATDLLNPRGALRLLYASDTLIEIIASVVGRERDHPYRLADPLGACSVNVYQKGWGTGWHFDESLFTVTLSLESASRGGEFEFSLPLRASSEELPISVGAYLDGTAAHPPSVKPFAPGTLSVFAGRHSLHRVTPVEEGRRVSAVLCFADTPGVVNSPLVQRTYWGRES